MSESTANVLSVQGLVTVFETAQGAARAVDDVSFEVPEGGKVALVGESGCGKTVTALSILRLLPEPVGRIEAGKVLLRGVELVGLSEREMRRVRGDKIAMVFQEPMTSLNPVFTVGFQIVEAIRAHRRVSRREAREQALELLRTVGIGSPQTRIDAYPHELSGGMRQRVMIAIGLSCEPDLLIADEPTTALDVTTQAQLLDLLDRVREQTGTATLLITHDLAVVAGFAQHVVVMYAGQVVESASVRDVFARPAHPYTKALLRSLPGAPGEPGKRSRLCALDGRVPSLVRLPTGCRFRARCSRAQDRCAAEGLTLRGIGEARWVRCHFPEGDAT